MFDSADFNTSDQYPLGESNVSNLNSSTSTAYGKRHNTRDVESDVNSDALSILTSTDGRSIPADLAVLIESWAHLSTEAKKDILAIVRKADSQAKEEVEQEQ